jgi:hypothetical protein
LTPGGSTRSDSPTIESGYEQNPTLENSYEEQLGASPQKPPPSEPRKADQSELKYQQDSHTQVAEHTHEEDELSLEQNSREEGEEGGEAEQGMHAGQPLLTIAVSAAFLVGASALVTLVEMPAAKWGGVGDGGQAW